MRFILGMIVGATEFGPGWFGRLCHCPNRLLERVAKTMDVRGDGRDFFTRYLKRSRLALVGE